MQGQFDIIVIGSGLGGLECGAMLAREGMGVCVAEQAALDFQKFCPALVPAQKMKQSVKCSQHRINGHRGVVFREQVIPPFGNQFPGNWSAVQPAGKGPDIPEILFNGAGAPLLPPQMCRI